MKARPRSPRQLLLASLVLSLGISALLLSCESDDSPAETTPVDYSVMVSDSTIIYDGEDYHEILVVYSMPASIYSTKKRGYIREQLYGNADILSIDTVKSTIREEPLMKRWAITGRMK